MKPIHRYLHLHDVFENFTRMARRSKQIDSFLLGCVLYFRYFLKLNRILSSTTTTMDGSGESGSGGGNGAAAGTGSAGDAGNGDAGGDTDVDSSGNLLGGWDNNFGLMRKGPNATADIWKDMMDRRNPARDEREKKIRLYRARGDDLMRVLGLGYAQLLVSIANFRTKESNREKAFFEVTR